MKRQHQALLIGSTLVFSWLAMQVVHELGHVFGAWLSGGTVVDIVLHPTTISHTQLAENPHPLFVAWMGPLVGVAVPTAALCIARNRRTRGWYLFQFFAGFCLVANGAYIAFGSINRIGDAGEMLRHGTPSMLLWLFGAITIPSGLWLWHGLGSHFGLREARGQMDPRAAYVMTLFALAAIVAELLFS
jgi:hypothetical protein